MEKIIIPTPCQQQLNDYCNKWKNDKELENYRIQEQALNKLFHELLPLNNDISAILIKSSILNDFIKIADISLFKGNNSWNNLFRACVGMRYLSSIESLAQYFNATLFTGIRRCEAHYACYPSGFGYQWHKDNPIGRDERVISAVYYLNDDWSQTDGGEILVVDKFGNEQKLLPKANRLVLFDSEL